jgi:hypothetical protein
MTGLAFALRWAAAIICMHVSGLFLRLARTVAPAP